MRHSALVTLSITNNQHNDTQLHAECHCAECGISFIVKLSIDMLNVIVMNVVILSVVAPTYPTFTVVHHELLNKWLTCLRLG